MFPAMLHDVECVRVFFFLAKEVFYSCIRDISRFDSQDIRNLETREYLRDFQEIGSYFFYVIDTEKYYAGRDF